MISTRFASTLALIAISALSIAGETPSAKITGMEPGWTPLLEAVFSAVNGADDTWVFDDENNAFSCNGKSTGVIHSTNPCTNLELVIEWMHEKPAGNSGVFVWTCKAALDALTKPGLPDEVIEVQVLGLAHQVPEPEDPRSAVAEVFIEIQNLELRIHRIMSESATRERYTAAAAVSESAKPFECNRPTLRHPKATKGQDYNATTEASNCHDGGDCC
jgi:hypothetical protein